MRKLFFPALCATAVLAACGTVNYDDGSGTTTTVVTCQTGYTAINGVCTQNTSTTTTTEIGDSTCRNTSGQVVTCPTGRACNGTIVMNTTAPSGRSLESMEIDPIRNGETLTTPYWEKIQEVSGTSNEISCAGGGATQVLVQARATGDINDGKWDAYGHGPTAHLTMNTTVRCGGETMNCALTWSPPGGIPAGSARFCYLP